MKSMHEVVFLKQSPVSGQTLLSVKPSAENLVAIVLFYQAKTEHSPSFL